MKRSCVLVLVLLFGLVTPAAAETRRAPGNVSFDIPTGWDTKERGSGGEGVLIALSPDEEASIVFAVADAQNLEKAVKALDAMLGKFVTNAKTSKAGKVTVGGMPGVAAKGEALVKQQPVRTAVVILQTKSKKLLFVIGIVNATKAAAYRKTLDEVIASIKPTE